MAEGFGVVLRTIERQRDEAWLRDSEGSVQAARLSSRLLTWDRRDAAFAACNRDQVCCFVMRCSECGAEHDSIPLGCNQRWCPLCATYTRAEMIERITAILTGTRPGGHRPRWRFLTLTIRSRHDGELAAMKRELLAAWERLRHRAKWSRWVSGCVATLETTYHRETGWHVHLHAAVCGAFMPWEELGELWEKVTKGLGLRWGVSIKDCGTNAKGAARELAKYLGKGTHKRDASDEWDDLWSNPKRVAELMLASERWRMLRTYGACYAAEQELPESESRVCELCGGELRYDRTEAMTRSGYDRRDHVRATGPPVGTIVGDRHGADSGGDQALAGAGGLVGEVHAGGSAGHDGTGVRPGDTADEIRASEDEIRSWLRNASTTERQRTGSRG